jgi:hypothetical protein
MAAFAACPWCGDEEGVDLVSLANDDDVRLAMTCPRRSCWDIASDLNDAFIALGSSIRAFVRRAAIDELVKQIDRTVHVMANPASRLAFYGAVIEHSSAILLLAAYAKEGGPNADR